MKNFTWDTVQANLADELNNNLYLINIHLVTELLHHHRYETSHKNKIETNHK